MTAYEGPHPFQRRIGYIIVRVLERVLRLAGDYNYRFLVQQLHQGMYRDGFQLGAIRYYPDACSVGLTPQGQLTGDSAADLICDRDLNDLRVLDICCGAGIVGITMLSRLKDTRRINEISFADINIFNVTSVRRTLERNRSALPEGAGSQVFLSDGLLSVPARGDLDLIVSNPPHFDAEAFTAGHLDPVALGNADPAWKFHRDFYDRVHDYLKPGGEVWFFENGDACSTDILLPIVAANPELEYVESFKDERDEKFFWMITRRRSAGA